MKKQKIIKLNDEYNAFLVGKKVAVHLKPCTLPSCEEHDAVLTRSEIQRVLDGKLERVARRNVSYVGNNVTVGCQEFPLRNVRELLTLFPKKNLTAKKEVL